MPNVSEQYTRMYKLPCCRVTHNGLKKHSEITVGISRT